MNTLALESEPAHQAVSLFPLGATMLVIQLLYLLIPTCFIFGGIWYLWRLLRAVERIAEGLNKQQ